ncbi:MAG TPA: DUF1905 domain-containing protein [Bacillota bacterium]
MSKREFQAKLQRQGDVGTWTILVVPFNVAEAFGTKARVAVKGTINGQPYRGSVMPFGDGTHYMVVNKTTRDAAALETLTSTGSTRPSRKRPGSGGSSRPCRCWRKASG